MSSAAAVAIGVAVAAGTARYVLRAAQSPEVARTISGLRLPDFSNTMKGYYRGGFDEKMTRLEASKILGIPVSKLDSKTTRAAHRRLLLSNHPDKGGSPYLAQKINEAKDFLD